MGVGGLKRFGWITVGTCMLFFVPQPAFAYIDPGTGSMILQLLLAGLAGAALFLRSYWAKVKKILGFRRDTREEEKPAKRS